MQITELVIKGPGIKGLSVQLENALPHCFRNMESDVTHVFVNEKYYLRSDGLLMTNIVINYSQEHRASIQIIVGGGGGGLFSLDWNLEKQRTKEIIAFLESFCQAQDWQLKIQKQEILEEFEE